jgi:hypothetical protein
MSYDLHVVRTTDWIDAHTNPITKSDVEMLISSDPELSWSESYIDMRVDDEVTRFHLIEWKGSPVFWWYQSEIIFKSPDESALIKLIEIANSLNAYVVGDDGESYRLTKDESGILSVEVFQLASLEGDSSQPTPIANKKPWYRFW